MVASDTGAGSDSCFEAVLRVRIERPIPSTAAPSSTVKNERYVIGKPDTGVKIISVPSTIMLLERDIWAIVSGDENDHKLAAYAVRMCGIVFFRIRKRARHYFLVKLGELSSNNDVFNACKACFGKQF